MLARMHGDTAAVRHKLTTVFNPAGEVITIAHYGDPGPFTHD
jgi:hypothetical protein